jgi:plastocyanin
MRFRKTMFSGAAIILCFAVSGCGGGSDGSSLSDPSRTDPGGTGLAPNAVAVVAVSFAPATLNVAAGTTVTWQWSQCDGGGYTGGGSCIAHNVAFDDGSNIISPTQDSGTFSRAFTVPGTYHYHCTIHGSAMSGQIIVK